MRARTGFSDLGVMGRCVAPSQSNEGGHMSLWLLILIIVIAVLLLDGFGYSRWA